MPFISLKALAFHPGFRLPEISDFRLISSFASSISTSVVLFLVLIKDLLNVSDNTVTEPSVLVIFS